MEHEKSLELKIFISQKSGRSQLCIGTKRVPFLVINSSGFVILFRPSCIYEPNRTFASNISLEACNGVVFRVDIPFRTGIYMKKCKIIRPCISQKTRPKIDRNRPSILEPDTAAEKRKYAASRCKFINIRALKEKIALFGKHDGKSRQVNLTLINFCFGKIGINGKGSPQTWSNTIVDVEATIGGGGFVCSILSGYFTAINNSKGNHFEPYTLRHARKPGENSCILRALNTLVPQVARPEYRFAFSAYDSHKINSPAVAVGIKIKGSKGNAYLGRPANVGNNRPCVPNPIPVQVY